jgi:hypothetical protein
VDDRKTGWQDDRRPWVVRRRIDNPNPSGCQATVGATAEPALSADAVDDRALNSQAGERFKRNAPGRVEARGGVEEAFSSVGNEIVQLNTAAECPRSCRASDGSNEMKMIHDTLIARVVNNLHRCCGLHDPVLAHREPCRHRTEKSAGWRRRVRGGRDLHDVILAASGPSVACRATGS